MSSGLKVPPLSGKLAEQDDYRDRLNQIVSDLGGRDAMSTKEYEIAQQVAALNIGEICSLVARVVEERSRAAQKQHQARRSILFWIAVCGAVVISWGVIAFGDRQLF
jgi:hypothetical protein